MNRFQTRLLVALLLVTFFVLATFALLVGQLVTSFHKDTLSDRLEREVQWSALTLEKANRNQWEPILTELSKRLDVLVKVSYDGEELFVDPKEGLLSNVLEEMERSFKKSEIFTETATFSFGNETGELQFAYPDEQLNKENRYVWIFILVSSFLSFLIIGMMSYRITLELTRPISHVTNVANELARGNFKVRTHERRKDEIGQLMRSMNMLAYNLDQITTHSQIQHERLEALIHHMGSGLIFINERGDIAIINQYCKDIFHTNTDQWLNQLYHQVIPEKAVNDIIQQIFFTEQKTRKQIKLTDRVPEQHYEIYGAPVVGDNGELRGVVLVLHDITELKRLENIRRDFVANVSHELKTPMTSLKGFTETLLDGAMYDEKALEQFLGIIWKESDRLAHLIDDLLVLSKLEKEDLEFEWEQILVIEIAEEVVELLRSKAEEKNIELSTSFQPQLTMIGDSHRFRQILINLMSNAINYTPSEGKVWVEVKQEENKIVLVVRDNGFGISEEELPRIFERFYRVDKARSRDSGGTGLGLAIVKHIVEAFEGEIEVESEQGKGTTFTVKLPIKK